MIRMLRWVPVLLGLTLAACASTAEREAEQSKKKQFVETHVQLGASYLERGQLDIARTMLEKALDARSDDPQANNMMALLQWRLRNVSEAEKYFRRAVDAAPANPEAENNYGVFLCQELRRYEEAIRWFEKVASNQYYGSPAAAYENAGLCLMTKPAPAEAEKYFREALRFNPRQAKSLYEMARISYDAGKALSARGFIQRYFQSAGDTPASLLLASRIERALKNRDGEASYAVRLTGKFPESPEALQLVKETAATKAVK
jgi:type IV pilus assembly protein PilF